MGQIYLFLLAIFQKVWEWNICKYVAHHEYFFYQQQWHWKCTRRTDMCPHIKFNYDWPIVTDNITTTAALKSITHDDFIKWKHFPRYWPFVRRIHGSPVNSPHKGQWRGALMFSLNWAWTNGWVNNRDAGDLRRHCAHYDVTVMRYARHLGKLINNCSCCNKAFLRITNQ